MLLEISLPFPGLVLMVIGAKVDTCALEEKQRGSEEQQKPSLLCHFNISYNHLGIFNKSNLVWSNDPFVKLYNLNVKKMIRLWGCSLPLPVSAVLLLFLFPFLFSLKGTLKIYISICSILALLTLFHHSFSSSLCFFIVFFFLVSLLPLKFEMNVEHNIELNSL